MSGLIKLTKQDIYFRFFLTTVLVMPFFPKIFSNSLLINYLILGFSLLTFLLVKINKISSSIAIYFFYSVLMFFLIVFSTYYSQIEEMSISLLMNFARPIFLMLATVAIYLLISKNYFTFYKNIVFIVFLLLFVYAVFACVERFLGDVIYYVYKMHYKTSVANATVSIYMFNYYSSYINTVFLILMFSFYSTFKEKKYLILSIFLLFFIALSHSKVGFVSALMSVVLIYLINNNIANFLLKTILVLLSGLIVLLFYKDVILYLNSSFNLPLFRWLEVVLVNKQESYTVDARLEQIYMTMEWISSNNFLLGIGSERNSPYLTESWIAEYLFRYGYIGTLLFVGFMTYLFFISYRSFIYFRKKDKILSALSVAAAVWVIISPIILLSSMMMDRSKTGLVACLMIALILSLPRYKKQYLEMRSWNKNA